MFVGHNMTRPLQSKSMLRILLPGCKRKILFTVSLNFSPDSPHPTAKFASLEIKFSCFRLGREISTYSKHTLYG